ncbi:putative CENPB DNA-binding domain-containing protein 1 [Phocoena phocoena]|uniref:putative CENPB DNA-binding domain-containing protein 1 n=1 Tax=Phocoena phocoena TaxID=9742 RepID=UPI003306AE95
MSRSKRKCSSDVAGTAKKRQVITIERKVNTTERVEQGEKMVNIACSYKVNLSTIGTILKNKDKDHGTREISCADDVDNNIEEAWKSDGGDGEISQVLDQDEDQHQHQDLLSLMLTQEKAKRLYEDLNKKHGEKSEGASFNAIRGWFHWFQARANLHNVKVSGEAVSAGTVAAWEFRETL